jgi:regulator of sirC expression with transglutaminase-like and TPR domain
VDQQLGQLDRLAEYVQRELAGGEGGRAQENGPDHFLRVVTHQLDFHGDQENYYDPRNSLLPDVLERRMGLPIMLCLVCIAIGRRLGFDISGLGFPNHFLALYRDASGESVLDPFLGITLARGDVERHLARMLGRPVQLAPDAWRPLTAQEITLRILHNLRNAYLTAKNLPMVVQVLDFLLAAKPDEPQYWRERGLIHHRERRWVEAHYDLRRYLLRVGLLAAVAPAAEPGAAPAKPPANQGDQRVLEMYREASVMLSRIN